MYRRAPAPSIHRPIISRRLVAPPLRLGVAGARFYMGGGQDFSATPWFPVMRVGSRLADEPPALASGQFLRGVERMVGVDTSPSLAHPIDGDLRLRELCRQIAETRPLLAKGRHTPSANTSNRRGRRRRFRPCRKLYPVVQAHQWEVAHVYNSISSPPRSWAISSIS